MHVQDAERVFCVYEALKRGIDHKVIYDITKICLLYTSRCV